MIAVILTILLQFNQVLVKYGCQSPRLFALKDEVVLSCEIGDWPENQLIKRSSVLLSSLAFSYPYGKKYSLVLRKYRIPSVQIVVDRKDIVDFLAGKLKDFSSKWRVYSLKGRVFRFYGLPMSIISAVVNPAKEELGKIEITEFSCKEGSPRLSFSYAFVDRGQVMFIIKGEETKIVEFLSLKGSGEKKWRTKTTLPGEITAEFYLWRGNWIKIWEGKTRCNKEEK